MARYDLSVSPHSLATFTKSTGFPAKLEKSTRRPDRAVARKSCSCISFVQSLWQTLQVVLDAQSLWQALQVV